MNSFNIGDYVVYGHSGVCRIDRIESRCFDKKSEDYYVLAVLHNQNSTVFVPVNSEALTINMRPPMTKEEIDTLLACGADEDVVWIDDKKERPKYIKEIISSGDKRRMLAMMKILFERKQDLMSKHKALPSGEERALADLEKLIYEEFSFVLGIGIDDVEQYIVERIRK